MKLIKIVIIRDVCKKPKNRSIFYIKVSSFKISHPDSLGVKHIFNYFENNLTDAGMSLCHSYDGNRVKKSEASTHKHYGLHNSKNFLN